jgi:hypothetical protein
MGIRCLKKAIIEVEGVTSADKLAQASRSLTSLCLIICWTNQVGKPKAEKGSQQVYEISPGDVVWTEPLEWPRIVWDQLEK